MHIWVTREYEISRARPNYLVEMQLTIGDFRPVLGLGFAIEDYELGHMLYELEPHSLDSTHSDIVELILAILESLAIQPSALDCAIGRQPIQFGYACDALRTSPRTDLILKKAGIVG